MKLAIGLMALAAYVLTISSTPRAWASPQAKAGKPAKAPPGKPAPSKPAPAPGILMPDEAFFYFLAIYGMPADAIDRYGQYFDAHNYKQAMADEFSRQQYRSAIRKRLDSAVRSLNFNTRFIAIGQGELGEYNFDAGGFPFKRIPEFGYCMNADHSSGVCYGSLMDVDTISPKTIVNNNAIRWVLPMTADAAAAFVRGRQSERGSVDRSVTFKVVYSIVNKRARVKADMRDAVLYPLVHSLEIFADETLARKLGSLSIAAPTKYRNATEWGDAIRSAESPVREVGQYTYTAYTLDYMRGDGKPVPGTLVLKDTGISLSGEQNGKPAQPRDLTFYDLLIRTRADEKPVDSRLVRSNYVNNTWGNKSFRVVWSAIDRDDYDSPLVFATLAERDRFFGDLASTVQAWVDQYRELGPGAVAVDERCMVRGYLVTCSQTNPFDPKAASEVGDPDSQTFAGDTAGDASSAPVINQAAGREPAGSTGLSDVTRVSGAYVSRSGDRVELREDGTFVLTFRGQSMRGSFTVQGEEISLKLPTDPRPARTRLTNAGLIFPSGETYTKR